MRRLPPLFIVVMSFVACITDTRVSRDRGAGGFFENVPLVEAPAKKRCETYGPKGTGRGRCDEAKYLAEIYVKKLSTGDMICLEGGFGDEPGAGCQARAAIADTATGKVLVEMKDARPDSRWFQKETNQYWFEEGALVDLYLAEHGY
jgi:hypothetical protein